MSTPRILSRKKILLISLCFAIVYLVMNFTLNTFDFCDDIWRYHNCYRIANGGIIYKDFTCLSMPLYYFLYSIPLLFGKGIRVMNAAGALVIMGISYFGLLFFYKSKRDSYFQVFVWLLICIKIINDTYDYNYLEVVFILMLFNILLEPKQKRKYILAGIVTGLMILTKQTVGAVAFLILSIIFSYSFFYIISVCIPLLVFGVYLFFTHSFNAFLDCTFFGAGGFFQNLHLNPFNLFGFIVFCICTYILIGMYGDYNHRICSVLGIACAFSLAFPLLNSAHNSMSFLVLAPLICMYIEGIRLKWAVLVFVFGIVLTFVGSLKFYVSSSYDSRLDGRFSTKLMEDEEDIIEFIETHENVRSVEATHAYHMLSAGKLPEKYYSIFLRGNIGNHTPEEILTELKDGYVYIYRDDDDVFWQTPKAAREYVKKNFKKFKNVGKYVVYAVQ